VRVTTAFSRLVRLEGIWVSRVSFEAERVVVDVVLVAGGSSDRYARTRRGRARTPVRSTRSGVTSISRRGVLRSAAGGDA
jgi:hypothetical protein